MDLKNEKNRSKVKDELRGKITTLGSEIELDLHEYDKNEYLHSILCNWKNPHSQNFLMLAIVNEKKKAVCEILDYLNLGATDYGLWTKEDFVEFLCETDHDGNNVLQLALLHQSDKKSDGLLKILLEHVENDRNKLADLVDNLNNNGKSSVNLAFNERWDKDITRYLLKRSKTHDDKGMMRAIIFYNDVEENKRNAHSLDEALCGRGFNVKHWKHKHWSADNLLHKLTKTCREDMEQLWVVGLTHGVDGYIFDSSEPIPRKIEINSIVQTLIKASGEENEVTTSHI